MYAPVRAASAALGSTRRRPTALRDAVQRARGETQSGGGPGVTCWWGAVVGVKGSDNAGPKDENKKGSASDVFVLF